MLRCRIWKNYKKTNCFMGRFSKFFMASAKSFIHQFWEAYFFIHSEKNWNIFLTLCLDETFCRRKSSNYLYLLNEQSAWGRPTFARIFCVISFGYLLPVEYWHVTFFFNIFLVSLLPLLIRIQHFKWIRIWFRIQRFDDQKLKKKKIQLKKLNFFDQKLKFTYP